MLVLVCSLSNRKFGTLTIANTRYYKKERNCKNKLEHALQRQYITLTVNINFLRIISMSNQILLTQTHDCRYKIWNMLLLISKLYINF